MLDAVLLVNIILQTTETPVGAALVAADVDSNGVINVSVRRSATESDDKGSLKSPDAWVATNGMPAGCHHRAGDRCKL